MADMDGDGEIELTEFTGTLLTGRVGGDCRVAGDIRKGITIRERCWRHFARVGVENIVFFSLSVQIETIFELGDVDGDGEIELGEFIGIVYPSRSLYHYYH